MINNLITINYLNYFINYVLFSKIIIVKLRFANFHYLFFSERNL